MKEFIRGVVCLAITEIHFLVGDEISLAGERKGMAKVLGGKDIGMNFSPVIPNGFRST